ncbi:RTA-like protein, partial [Gilbertella persicaria]|uniref:RTA-like protein n=1 Tax=Gilbertella persicaria TaxID=101096 RepID=UPI00221F3CCD
YYYFHYNPSIPLAVVAAVLFGLFGLYLAARVHKFQSPRFLYTLPITALCECVGYALRIKSHAETTTTIFVIMTLLLLLPPGILAHLNYRSIVKVIQKSHAEPKHFFLKPDFVMWFFSVSNKISIMVQCAGGGIKSSGKINLSDAGSIITLIGFAFQMFFFAVFLCIAFFIYRSDDYDYYVKGQSNPKRNLLYCLCITISLLIIRYIFRIVEYATTYNHSEWAFYTFDSLMVLLCFVCYSIL